jgi:hypothetical protein
MEFLLLRNKVNSGIYQRIILLSTAEKFSHPDVLTAKPYEEAYSPTLVLYYLFVVVEHGNTAHAANAFTADTRWIASNSAERDVVATNPGIV